MAFDFQTVFGRALPYGQYLERYATPDQRTRWAGVYEAARLTDEQLAIIASFRRKMYVLCMAGAWCGDCVNACPMFQRVAEARPDLIDLRFVNRAQQFDPTRTGGAALPRPGTADDPEDIRSRPMGKILVKWGIITPERIDKALLTQEERKAQGLNVRIGDVLTEAGAITAEQRDRALAAQGGYESVESWDVAVAKELMICGAPRVPMLVFLSEDWMECERYGERTLATYREKARKQLTAMQGASCPTGLFLPPAELLAANLAEWLGHFERVQWMLLTSPRLMKLNGEV
jgi:ferredoxin